MRLTTLGGDRGRIRGTSQEAVAVIQGRVHGDLGQVVTMGEVRSLLLEVRSQRKSLGLGMSELEVTSYLQC